MTLDLKSPEGMAIFYRLVAEGRRRGGELPADVKYRLGIDYETLSAMNPRLVYGSISGFGQDGPYADRAGFDQIAQGMGGLMSSPACPARARCASASPSPT